MVISLFSIVFFINSYKNLDNSIEISIEDAPIEVNYASLTNALKANEII